VLFRSVGIGVFNLRDRAAWTDPTDGIFWIETSRSLKADRVITDRYGRHAGIRPGDILIAINGQRVSNLGQHAKILYDLGINA